MARYAKRKARGQQVSAFLNPKKCKTTGKTQYATEKAANSGMMRMWSHDPKLDIKDVHVYQCPDCNGYHIGHKSYYQKVLQRQSEADISQSQINS